MSSICSSSAASSTVTESISFRIVGQVQGLKTKSLSLLNWAGARFFVVKSARLSSVGMCFGQIVPSFTQSRTNPSRTVMWRFAWLIWLVFSIARVDWLSMYKVDSRRTGKFKLSKKSWSLCSFSCCYKFRFSG